MGRHRQAVAVPAEATPDDDGSEPAVSWTVSPETERWLWVLSYGQFALLLGFGLWLAVGIAALTVVAALEGSWMVLVVLVAAVAFALARPPVLAILREEGASFGYEGWRPSRRGLIAAAVGGAVALGIGFVVSEVVVGAVVALGFGATLLAMVLTSEGSIDPESLTLETKRKESSLAGLSGVRSVAVGPVRLFWLSYVRGAGGLRTPHLLTVPRGVVPAVRAALDAGLDAPAEADPIGRPERVVVALFGAGTLAVAPALWLASGGGDGPLAGLLVYLWLLSLVVAAPMLWYAATA
jgi:hypothetical protein